MSYILKDIDVIVPMDGRRVFEDKSIVIEESRIADIGGFEELKRRWGSLDVIDCRGKVALPGLIDLHGHSIQAFFRGSFDEQPLSSWLAETGRVYESMDDEMKRMGACLTFLEKIRFGVTTSLDMERDVSIVVEEAGKLGLRLIEASVMFDTEEVLYSGLSKVSSIEEEIRRVKSLVKKFRGAYNGRVEVIFGPVGFPASSPELLREAVAEARSMGIRLHTHVSESFVNVELSRKIYGLREVELLEKIGFLGPDTILAHAVYLSDYEIKALSKYRSSVVHCPSSNAKLGNGIARVAEMLWNNIPVGLGCDGAASNNSQDLFLEMKLASLLQKARLRNASILSPWKLLEMVTIGAARILGKDRYIGSIEVGKKADIILLDLRKTYFIPRRNIVSHLVYSARGSDVDMVIIDGKILYRDGIFNIPLDLEEFYKKVEEKYGEIVSRFKWRR